MSRGYAVDRLRTRLREVAVARIFRVIHRSYRATPLGATAAPSRFGDPQERYAVLYAAQSVRCAFWEALARNRFTRRKRRELPRADIEARLVASIRSTERLALIDLRDDGPARIGAPSAVAHDSNHAAGRALSAAVHAGIPDADGFLYPSRFTGDACVAVFDRALAKLAVLETAALASHVELLDALEEYDIVLTGPQGAQGCCGEHADGRGEPAFPAAVDWMFGEDRLRGYRLITVEELLREGTLPRTEIACRE